MKRLLWLLPAILAFLSGCQETVARPVTLPVKVQVTEARAGHAPKDAKEPETEEKTYSILTKVEVVPVLAEQGGVYAGAETVVTLPKGETLHLGGGSGVYADTDSEGYFDLRCPHGAERLVTVRRYGQADYRQLRASAELPGEDWTQGGALGPEIWELGRREGVVYLADFPTGVQAGADEAYSLASADACLLLDQFLRENGCEVNPFWKGRGAGSMMLELLESVERYGETVYLTVPEGPENHWRATMRGVWCGDDYERETEVLRPGASYAIDLRGFSRLAMEVELDGCPPCTLELTPPESPE